MLTHKHREYMGRSFKKNWRQTKRNFTDWWNREGLVLDGGPVPGSAGLREAPPEQGA